jgi:flagellar hook-associated protein 3 FlgL
MINATGNRLTLEINRQSRLARQIEESQISISTGRRYQRASQAPLAAAKTATSDRQLANIAVWQDNVVHARSLIDQADSVLQNMNQNAARVQELVLAGASATLSDADRATIAGELRALADEMLSLADSRTAQGDSLFASGNALVMRFDTDASFAPLPSRAEMFTLGGRSLADVVNGAATAIESGGSAEIESALRDAGSVVSFAADAAANLGQRAARVERLEDNLAAQDIALRETRSRLVDTDLSEAIARLNAQTLTLQAAQAAFVRINQQSLLDLLG